MDIKSVIEQNFVAIYANMTLGEIVHGAIVKSNRNIFPVIDKETENLEGIILLDDLRPVMFDQTLYDEVIARDLMQNAPAIIILGEDKMTEVMKKFQDTGAWNLPVILDGKYYGFVSKSKLLTAYRRKLIDFSGKH
jgi:CIC family chloride channel protein